LKAAAYTTGGVNWHKLFNYYDRDKSGAIEFDEFRQLLRSDAKISKSHLSDRDAKLLFDVVDVDGSGEMEWSDFDAWVHNNDPSGTIGRTPPLRSGGGWRARGGGSAASSPRRSRRPASSSHSSSTKMHSKSLGGGSQRSPSARSSARQPSARQGGSSGNHRQHKGGGDAHLNLQRADNELYSESQMRVFNRLQALRHEHEERLAAVEDQFSGEVERLSSRVEDANNLRHRDVERAMDEMDDMRRRLIGAHKRSENMLHARADEQIAQMEREKLADAAQYESRIQRLETERVTLAEDAVQANDMREELERQRAAYRQLEIEHASELRDLMRERRDTENVSGFFRFGRFCFGRLFLTTFSFFGLYCRSPLLSKDIRTVARPWDPHW
jgi:hypothetical protein